MSERLNIPDEHVEISCEIKGFECTACALEAKEISRYDVEVMHLCKDCSIYVGNQMFWFGSD